MEISGQDNSKLESGKIEPAFSSVARIAKTLGVSIANLFEAGELLKDVNSADKYLIEKVTLIELLDKKERAAFHAMLEAFINKKKLKDALSETFQGAD
ncbi:MAG TPA: hypothetical protein PKM97_07600 [Bacteroidia bacterium]|nr:hypothetical protein [Bacteroidia bacterium]